MAGTTERVTTATTATTWTLSGSREDGVAGLRQAMAAAATKAARDFLALTYGAGIAEVVTADELIEEVEDMLGDLAQGTIFLADDLASDQAVGEIA